MASRSASKFEENSAINHFRQSTASMIGGPCAKRNFHPNVKLKMMYEKS
jgi:hypothetical protein